MNVLLVADFYPPAPGGLEAHVRRLAHALAARGHRVEVVSGGPARETLDDDGVPVHFPGLSLDRLPGTYRETDHRYHPPWPDPAFRRGIRKALDRFPADIIHAHGWCQFSAADEARRGRLAEGRSSEAVVGGGGRHGAAERRIPLVVTLHDHGLRCPKKNLLRGTAECARGRGLRCLKCAGDEQGTAKRALLSAAIGLTAGRLAGRVDRFIAVSGHVARRFREAVPGRVTVVPNFLELPNEPFAEPTGSGVLFVGTAARHKGLPVFLDAVRLLPAGLAEVTVVGVSAGQAAPWSATRGAAVGVAQRNAANGAVQRKAANAAAQRNAANAAQRTAADGAVPPEGTKDAAGRGAADGATQRTAADGAAQRTAADGAAQRTAAHDATPGGDGVEFAGRLGGEELWRRYREAALVVVPSVWPEPCPTVALEALAFGRPVVASRIGGLPDLVEDGRTGLLVPPGDAGALAAAITGLLNDPVALKAMSVEAHASAAAFGTDAVVGRIEAVYREAVR